MSMIGFASFVVITAVIR